MNDYTALRVDATPCNSDITDLAAAALAEAGYESFCPDEKGLTAYIPASSFSLEKAEQALADFPIDTAFTLRSDRIEGRDWNAEWEKNYYKPIVIGSRCVIHSTFHTDVPHAEYDIAIDPRMAFGTGHHATTSQMLEHLLDADLRGKSVIDMGTGTGILAILAKMLGAAQTIGIEIDEGAWLNAVDNARLNGVEINLVNGDVTALETLGEADVFLANINRNIILADIEQYAAHLKRGGSMYLSGFYENDIPLVRARAEELGLSLVDTKMRDNWVAVHFRMED